MSFFEPPPPPAEPPEPPRIVERPWWQPPRNELGVSTGLRLALARTEDLVVALIDAVAYSTGLTFTLAVVRRGASEPFFGDPLEDAFGHGHFGPRRQPGQELPPELLRFGVQFSDGRKATTLDSGGSVFTLLASDEEAEPEGPILSPRGGNADGDGWELGFWLWPLPPPGPLALVVEWPANGIELTRHEVPAEPLLEAGSRSEALWPATPPSVGS
jgi:hypothetical protein